MRFKSHKILIAFAVAFLAICRSTSYAEIIFTSNMRADFTFTTVGTTLGLPDGTILPFTALGEMTFRIDNSVVGATSMNFTNATGALTVTSPTGFAGASMGPYSFVGGQLQNITYDGLGNINSGNVVGLGMLWEMQLGATRLYTKDALPFHGAITGAPFRTGDVLSGAPEFNVFLDTGNTLTDPLVVIGRDRFLTVTAVPEPSSAALLLICGLGGWALKRRRCRVLVTSTS